MSMRASDKHGRRATVRENGIGLRERRRAWSSTSRSASASISGIRGRAKLAQTRDAAARSPAAEYALPSSLSNDADGFAARSVSYTAMARRGWCSRTSA